MKCQGLAELREQASCHPGVTQQELIHGEGASMQRIPIIRHADADRRSPRGIWT